MENSAESHYLVGKHPESEGLESLVGYNLKRAYMIFHADFRNSLGEKEITARAFSILTLVGQVSDINQSEISRRLGIERSGLVAIVDDLQEKIYIVRVAVPGDRRIQALALTRKGKEILSHAWQAIAQHEQRLLNDFSEKERKQLLSLLKKIRTNEVSSS